jgi:hypothetical protein
LRHVDAGVDALRARIAPGPLPVKAQADFRVADPLLSVLAEGRRNGTFSRLAGKLARSEGDGI